MAGQGKTTRDYSSRLEKEGWTVLFKCIPNTAHTGVVPITTPSGASKQRYPDIAAMREDTLLLVEVEVALNAAVSTDIRLRFAEMVQGLSMPSVYLPWAARVSAIRGVTPPDQPTIVTRLLIASARPRVSSPFSSALQATGIEVAYIND